MNIPNRAQGRCIVFWRRLSIQWIIASSALVLIVLIIITYITVRQSTRTIEDNSSGYIELALSQTNKNMENTLRFAQNATNSILNNRTFQKILQENEKTKDSEFNNSQIVREIMGNVFHDNNIIRYMELEPLSPNETINTGLCSNKMITEQLKAKADRMNGGTYWVLSDQNVCNSYEDLAVYGIRKVLNVDNLGRNLGYLVYALDLKIFQKLLEQDNRMKDVDILFLNQQGQLVDYSDNGQFESHKSEIYASLDTVRQQKTVTNKTHMITTYHSEYMDWTLIGVVPKKILTQGIDRVVTISAWVALLLTVVAIFLSLILARIITRPIQEIISQMRFVAFGNFNIHYRNRKYLNIETDQLAIHFKYMVENFRYLVQEVYEKQDLERKAELRALQAQINPHFLYNTLDNIFWVMEMEGRTEVSSIILSLSEMLRYALNRNSSNTTLRDELQHIDHYLNIINYRYPDRFHFMRDVPDELMECYVPRLFIQPIIENAISHGMEPKKESNQLHIRATLTDNDIVMVIEDDGIGMDEEKIREIFKKKHVDSRKGLGLLNVHDRLRLHFGEKYGVRIESKPGVGTKVVLTFPYRTI